MKTEKDLGIWMDHQSANVMEFTTDSIHTLTINSKFTHEEKGQTLEKGESLMQKKEQHEVADYYKELGKIIKSYTHVLLFGPTEAKVELFNSLKRDNGFAEISMEIKNTDKMTNNQQHAFVKAYFSGRV